MHKLKMQKKGCGNMTYEEYVEENTRKLEELKKLPYKELKRMEKEILNNPNSTRADIVNICVARGLKSIELGLPTYTLDEIEREFKVGKYRNRTRC